jgi:hypothetical protein
LGGAGRRRGVFGGGQHGEGEGAPLLALAAGLHVGVEGRDGDEVADVVALDAPRGRRVAAGGLPPGEVGSAAAGRGGRRQQDGCDSVVGLTWTP